MLQLLPEGILRHQVFPEIKKLVSVLATSTSVTETKEKTIETAETVKTAEVGKDGKESKDEYPNLAQVPCIWYLITFRKKSMSVLALLDSGIEIKAIHPTLAQELGLPIRPTDVRA